MKKNRQFAVLGLGRFGQTIVQTLSDNGYDVLCCDKNIDVVNQMQQYATRVIQADFGDEAAIRALGLNNFDVVIIATGANFESSVMATMMAKEIGVKTVISKAKTINQRNILTKVGADKVVLLERDMGIKLATNLITTNVIDYINFSDAFGIAEIEPKASWTNKSIRDSNIRATTGLNIVAVKRGEELIVSPGADVIIKAGDVLVIIGEIEKIQKLD